jgi:copper chaperone
MRRETVTVTGMSCTTCEQTVENALGSLDGVTRAEADHEGGTVEVVVGDDVMDDDLHAAVERAGFETVV